jgi:hypothetical protein
LINSQPRIEKEDLQGNAPAPEGEICRKTAKFNVILGAWPSGIIKHGRQSDSSHHPEIPILIIISPLLIAYIYTPNTLYPYYIPILPCKKYTIDGSSAAHAPLEVNETKRAALIREEKKEAELQDGTPQL